jgi:hypothetical protein
MSRSLVCQLDTDGRMARRPSTVVPLIGHWPVPGAAAATTPAHVLPAADGVPNTTAGSDYNADRTLAIAYGPCHDRRRGG